MTREIINLGTPPNGTDGDTIRTAMDKANDNFEELYASSPALGQDGFTFTYSSTGEVSVNIQGENVPPVLHYRFKVSGGSGMAASGNLIGGAGARPWIGSTWSDHSTAAYHLIATEDHTTTAQGTNFGILATPIGGNQANRVYVATFNGDGDIINSKGVSNRKIVSGERGRGIEIARDGSSAEFSMVSSQLSPYSSLIRAYAISGSVSSPWWTPQGQGMGIGLCGHDGVGMVGSKAIFGMFAASNWSSTDNSTYISMETTATGQTGRTERLRIEPNGAVRPGGDNNQSLGTSAQRWSVVFSATGSINTSDSRLKTGFRSLSDDEIEAAGEIAKSIGIYKWISSIDEKSDSARAHVGVYAQVIIEIMKSHGLNPFDYGFICHDTWGAIDSIVDEESGKITSPSVPEGDRYGIRYDQLSMFIIAAISKRIFK